MNARDEKLIADAVREGEALLDAQGRRLERRSNALVSLAIGGALLLTFCWMFRWEVIPANNAGHIRLDRWTGTTYFCGPESYGCKPMGSP